MKRKSSAGKEKSSGKQVTAAEFMEQLVHPLKAEMELLRQTILGADKRISERVKWNAPSYYYNTDIVTFNPRALQHVHLVFHHAQIEQVLSPLLEGTMKGRRMMYFGSIASVKAARREISRIVVELLDRDERAN